MRPILSAWSIIALTIFPNGNIVQAYKQKKIALAFSILLELLKNKHVINILANLQAYFNNCRYFPILMLKFVLDLVQDNRIKEVLVALSNKVQHRPVGVKIWNLKFDFKSEGTWHQELKKNHEYSLISFLCLMHS